MTAERHVLIVDDEPELAQVLAYRLRKQGYTVATASDGTAGLEAVRAGFDGIILLDLRLPDIDGLDLVVPMSQENGANRIIIMTAHGSIDHAIEATRRGAYDFVHKDDELIGRIAVAVKNAFDHREMTSRVSSLEEAVHSRYAFGKIVAQSPQMMRLFETLRHVVDSRVTVLLQGESGTGKELVARAIHYEGPRKKAPFVAVNCAGIPENLLESELFGHERGAFTGAIATKKGRFELADGGTLFLDEIGEMPFHLQAKLLRVLQERQVERVGSAEARPVDVRVISATHRSLRAMVAEKRFREDLYYRLAVFPIELPPLRDREGDIGLLTSHFLERACAEEGKEARTISPTTMRMFERYPFPGNVRELQNVISRAVVVSTGTQIRISDLPLSVVEAVRSNAALGSRPTGGGGAADLGQAFEVLFQTLTEMPALTAVEAALIRRALRLAEGHVPDAARALGMSRATIYRRLDKMGGKDAVLEEAMA